MKTDIELLKTFLGFPLCNASEIDTPNCECKWGNSESERVKNKFFTRRL